MSIPGQLTSNLLERWIGRGGFQPLVDEYLTDVCGPGSYYRGLVSSQGVEAADDWLERAHWVARRREIANSIPLVANGVLALLRSELL